MRAATVERSIPGIDGFQEEVVGTRTSGAEASFQPALACHHDDGQGGITVLLAQESDQVVAAGTGKNDVHEDEVGSKRTHLLLEAERIGAGADVVAARSEHRSQEGSLVWVVLHGEHPGLGGSARIEEVPQALLEGIPVEGFVEVGVRAAMNGLDLVHEGGPYAHDEHDALVSSWQLAKSLDDLVARAVGQHDVSHENVG